MNQAATRKKPARSANANEAYPNPSKRFANLYRCFKVLILAYLVLAANACQRKPPNILLISLDACRARNLSSYGYHRQTSPFLDQIAAEGIRFTNAFVNTHGTTPSHTTILTSLYQETHRVEFNGKANKPSEDKIPPEAVMIQELLKEHGYVTLAVTDGAQLSAAHGFNRGFVKFDDHGQGVKLGTGKMVRLIREYISTDHPLFAFYHTYEIHSPYLPPHKYVEMFGDFKSEFIPSSQNLLRSVNRAKQDLSDSDLDFLVASYDAGIRFTDDILRKMFGQLEELGFFKNYLLIITADHGEELAEHGGLLHRGLLYDELIHVPLIITGTGIPKGKVDHRMASSVDIAPTILRHLGFSAPPGMEGNNLLAPPHDIGTMKEAVFSQYGHFRYSIRTSGWKLIEKTHPHRIELYDMRQDPTEQRNLALKEPKAATVLAERLRKWRQTRNVLEPGKAGKVKLTGEQLKQLKSLGYVTGNKTSRN